MSSEHIDVGAYALGLLEDEDSAAFEAHLADCPVCTAQLAQFSPMKELLTGLGPVETPEDVAVGQGVTDLLSRRAALTRRRARWAVAIAAAACLAALGGGLAAGTTLTPSAPVSSPVLTGQLHTATNPRNGVTGTVGLVGKAWGTYVTLDLADVHGPLECELVAVAKNGESRVVAGWSVGKPGDGVPGHSAHLLVAGSTSIPLAELASFNVVVLNGRTLLSIPA
jgi:predicted anti-sigma-YlaC factor YlaD